MVNIHYHKTRAIRIRCETKQKIRLSKKDFEIYNANKTKSNPKEFYTYVL